MSRTATVIGTAPTRPPATSLVDAAPISRVLAPPALAADDLLDLADRTIADSYSIGRDQIEQLAHGVILLEPERQAERNEVEIASSELAREIAAHLATATRLESCQTDLHAERSGHAETGDLLLGRVHECLRLRSLLAQMSDDAARATRFQIRLERLCLKVTGETCAQLDARLDLEEAEERHRLQITAAERRVAERVTRASEAAQAYSRAQYADSPDTHVVEVPQ